MEWNEIALPVQGGDEPQPFLSGPLGIAAAKRKACREDGTACLLRRAVARECDGSPELRSSEVGPIAWRFLDHIQIDLEDDRSGTAGIPESIRIPGCIRQSLPC
jgi:hypothetical protein